MNREARIGPQPSTQRGVRNPPSPERLVESFDPSLEYFRVSKLLRDDADTGLTAGAYVGFSQLAGVGASLDQGLYQLFVVDAIARNDGIEALAAGQPSQIGRDLIRLPIQGHKLHMAARGVSPPGSCLRRGSWGRALVLVEVLFYKPGHVGLVREDILSDGRT